VKLTDEESLRRRLHAEADQAEVGPAPVEAVFRRYRAARTCGRESAELAV